jgi:hypothetical protein
MSATQTGENIDMVESTIFREKVEFDFSKRVSCGRGLALDPLDYKAVTTAERVRK